VRPLTTPPCVLRGALVGAALGLSLAATATAQTSRTNPTDVEGWVEAGLRVQLPGRWESSLRLRGRFVDDMSAYRATYLTTELEYSPRTELSVFGNYRVEAGADHRRTHRVATGAEQGWKRGETRLRLRSMVQHQRRPAADGETSGQSTAFARVRAEIARAVTDALDVYASVEPYFPLRDGAAYPVDNWRNTVGLEYAYARGRDVGLFYIYRPDYGRSYNRTFHIIGVELGATLDAGEK